LYAPSHKKKPANSQTQTQNLAGQSQERITEILAGPPKKLNTSAVGKDPPKPCDLPFKILPEANQSIIAHNPQTWNVSDTPISRSPSTDLPQFLPKAQRSSSRYKTRPTAAPNIRLKSQTSNQTVFNLLSEECEWLLVYGWCPWTPFPTQDIVDAEDTAENPTSISDRVPI
jgi:hypothetical protein